MNSKLRGYYNYYGIIGNSVGLKQYYEQARRILFKWLNRRSQRKSFTWVEFEKRWEHYRVMKPRIAEEPGAGKLHAGICAEVRSNLYILPRRSMAKFSSKLANESCLIMRDSSLNW